jgi:hypothetical protein
MRPVMDRHLEWRPVTADRGAYWFSRNRRGDSGILHQGHIRAVLVSDGRTRPVPAVAWFGP